MTRSWDTSGIFEKLRECHDRSIRDGDRGKLFGSDMSARPGEIEMDAG